MRHWEKWVYALAFAVLVTVLIGQIWCRPVDRDEGFWLYIPWRIVEGDVPYRDFVFPHMPLGALYYAGLTLVWGPSLYLARNFNVVLVLLSAGLITWAFLRRGMKGAAAAFPFLYLGSSLVLTWLVPVKAYGPLCLALAVATAALVWPRAESRAGLLRAFILGLAMGAAAAIRLQMLTLLPVGALVLWFGGRRESYGRTKAVLSYVAGYLVIIPLIVYYRVIAGDAFVFNVWTIHTLFVGQKGFPGGRLDALLELIIAADVVLLAAFALASLRTEKARAALGPFIFAAVLVLINFLPGSAQAQYFVVAAPSAAAAGAVGYAALYRNRRIIALLLIAIYVAFGAARPAAKIVFDRAHKELVGPTEVYDAAELLRENTYPDGFVYTGWPGYAALAERRVMPGWELGYFTDRIAERCDAETRRRYHLVTYEETAERLSAGEVEFALLGIDTEGGIETIIKNRFSKKGKNGGAILYKKITKPRKGIGVESP
jgi:hypothetical protein